MLRELFSWFDVHPQSYWVIAAVPTIVWLPWIAAGLRGAPGSVEGRRANFWFALLLLAVLLAWRWPPLLAAHDLNPDESQQIAGAITLQHDPVFWRSVDGHTSGPLNFYTLLPTHLLGLPQDYFNARLVGLLLVWGTLLACHHLLRSFYGTPLARLGMLPGVLFFALATDWDLIHYSTEHVSLFLVALSAWLLWRHHEPRAEARRSVDAGWLAGGFVAGLLPWAKLQSLPFAALLLAIGAWLVIRSAPLSGAERRARIAWLAVTAAIPSVAALGLVAATGQFEHFVRSYLAQNIVYMGDTGVSLLNTIGELARGSRITWQIPVFLIGPLLTVLAATGMALWQRHRSGLLYFAGALLTAMACFVILAPRRGSHHYLLFLVMPLTLWSGAALGDMWERVSSKSARWCLAVGFVSLAGLLPLAHRCRSPVPFMFGKFGEHWRHPYSEAGYAVRVHARPGDTLALWGWFPQVYVETDLPQATREANSLWQIMPSPQRDYYRARYMADLRRNQPALFVDAVGPGAFVFQGRTAFAHEIFPELREYVRQNFVLLLDTGYARVYVRPDRIMASK
jgi:hypothetical protein